MHGQRNVKKILYSRNKDTYCILKVCCTMSVLFPTKCCVFCKFICCGSCNIEVLHQRCTKFAQKDLHSRTGRDEMKRKTQERMERRSGKRSSSVGSEKMERDGDR